jgi:hypothetical protein
MISCDADLRALEPIRVGPTEVVYAFLSVAGEPSDLDEVLLDERVQPAARGADTRLDASERVNARRRWMRSSLNASGGNRVGSHAHHNLGNAPVIHAL